MNSKQNTAAAESRKRGGRSTQQAVATRTGRRKPQAPQQQGRRRQNPSAQRRRQAPKPAELKLYPLGGLDEVGKNMMLYECGNDMIMVDCGALFPESEMLGVDLVIPDFRFATANKNKIRGVLITHGHEDHIGALPYLLKEMNVPIYATRLTVGLIQNKLREHGLLKDTTIHTIHPGHKFKLGCFTINPINVNHSIPDAVSFAIESPAGVVIQTGDFKIDYTPTSGKVIDLATFAEYGDEGVLALLSDSTNSERPGMSLSESTVSEGLQNLFNKAEGKRIIVATFASNLYRVQHIIDLARRAGRKVAISGRSMVNNTDMAIELGYIRAPKNIFVDVHEIKNHPPGDIVLITTGSQGEPLSALARMSTKSHRNVHVGPDDCIIISAQPIPGNELTVTRLINGLLRLGAEVYYDRMYDVHASGHACQDEQKLLLSLVKPKYFLPVHGEYKHLKRHAQTAEAMGIPKQNIYIADIGDNITLSSRRLRTGDPVPSGDVMVDGLGVGDVGSVVLRDRRLLSEDGVVILSAAVDKKTGRLVSGPEVFTRGFVYVRESEELLNETRRAVQRVLQRYQHDKKKDTGFIKNKMRETASDLLYRKTRRKPMILPVLLEV